MRKIYVLKNTIASLLTNFLTIIIGLVAQAVFIKILGTEYLGLNSLFNNIISMLAIAELGIGSAIIYKLYKPIIENDRETIKSLMKFYKKSYQTIGLFVLIIGLVLMPFLKFFIDFETVTININIYCVYLLFLIDTVISYYVSYKRSILYADQKNYIINLTHCVFIIILNVLQLTLLYFTKNYFIYLILKIIVKFLENIAITYIANKKYNFLKEKDVRKLDENVEKDIFKKIKALFFHKIGAFVVLGTDNILISKLIGLDTLGLYSNYYLIIYAVRTVFGQITQATTASVGNMLETENKEKCLYIFNKIRFMNYWLSVFCATSILLMMDSFIKIWLGQEYILAQVVLIVLVIDLYQKLMRGVYNSFKEAAGIYYEDRFVPLLESALNIIFSIVCFKFLGLAGIFAGTIISSTALYCYTYPKYIYVGLLKSNYISYIKETIKYLIIFIIILIISYVLCNFLVFQDDYLNFIKNGICALIIPNVLLVIIFNKNENFKYYYKMLKNRLPRKCSSKLHR